MRYDCRYGMPHDIEIIGENDRIKVERCKLCRRTFRWRKFNGRINNAEYLKAHARNFAQRQHRTRGLWMKLYDPEKTKIILSPR